MRVFRRVTSGARKYKSASSRARATAFPFGTTSAPPPFVCAARPKRLWVEEECLGSTCPSPITPRCKDSVARGNSHGKVADILECRTLSRHDDISKERVVGVDIGPSLDSRDHRNPDVRNVLQSLDAFVMNSAPDERIGNISE